MMQSPSSYTYSNARHCYRLSGGIAQARIAALHSIAVTRPILSRYPQIARSYRRMRPSLAASRSRRPLQSNLSKHVPRFRALALFGRPLQERADSVGIPASKNLHNCGRCVTSPIVAVMAKSLGGICIARAGHRGLVEAGTLRMSLFDQSDMAAITSPDYPGERLIICRNADLARERARKRQELLAATEEDLAVIAVAVGRARKPLRGEAEIALKVGAVINRHKVAKHFELTIGEASFAFHRKTEAIAA
jgi:hypothetical protein